MTLFVTEIVCNFHYGYFDCSGAFQTVFDTYCLYNDLNIASNEASWVSDND